MRAANRKLLVIAHRDRENLAGRRIIHQLAQHRVRGRETHHQADLRDDTRPLDCGLHLGGLNGGHREWLLAEHVFARASGGEAYLTMRRGRCTDVHHIDCRVAEDLVERARALCASPPRAWIWSVSSLRIEDLFKSQN